MFTLSGAAAQQIRRAASVSGAQAMALRIAAILDADGSTQYGMGFDEAKEEDSQLLLEGVVVVIGPEFHELLLDTFLDYVELNPGEFNFIFSHGQPMPATSRSGASAGCVSAGCASSACGAGVCASAGRTL